MKEKTLVSVVTSNARMGCLNSYKADFAKLICADFGKSEFLTINIFNCYKALYSACSTFFRYLDFIEIEKKNCN